MKKCNPTVTFLDTFQSILRFINILEYSFGVKLAKNLDAHYRKWKIELQKLEAMNCM